jgi:predicted Zn finger-like uncharacterized protein
MSGPSAADARAFQCTLPRALRGCARPLRWPATRKARGHGMRLTCPNCGAQYEVPPEAIPPTGREVQCSNCQQLWFERGSAPAPQLVDPTPWDGMPAPEDGTEEEDDLADVRTAPPPQAPPRPRVDPAVSQILREEAQREEAARAAEAGAMSAATPEIRRAPARPASVAAPPAAPSAVLVPRQACRAPRPLRRSGARPRPDQLHAAHPGRPSGHQGSAHPGAAQPRLGLRPRLLGHAPGPRDPRGALRLPAPDHGGAAGRGRPSSIPTPKRWTPRATGSTGWWRG